MKIELDDRFELPDDSNWGRSFWKGFAYAVALGFAIAIASLWVGGYLFEKYYG